MPRPKTGGRQKGTPNKVPRALRTAFEDVFELLQADEDHAVTLHGWARGNPTEFYKLSAKLIPAKIQHEGLVSLEHLVVASMKNVGREE